jgi:hypothetical protein
MLFISSYRTDLRSRTLLHQDPLFILTGFLRAPTQVCLRTRSRTHFARWSTAPLAVIVSIPDLEILLLDNLEWKGLPINAFARCILRLLIRGVSIGVRVGRAGEDGGKELREQWFAARETAANDSDGGLDADDDE